MPVKYVVLNQGTLVVELWTGTISHDEVLAHERQHLSDASIERGASVLADAISATFETRPEAIHEVIDLYRQSAGQLRIGKVAVLANQLASDRARLFMKQANDLGLTVILFNCLDVACTWLGSDLTTVCMELTKLRASIAHVD